MRIIRQWRRIIIKQFGSLKMFVTWCALTLLIIYLLDSFLLSGFRAQTSTAVTTRAVPPDKLAAHEQPPADVQQQLPKSTLSPPLQAVKDAEPAKPPEPQQHRPIECGMQQSCPMGQHSYKLSSGIGRDGSPIICFDNKYLMSAEKKNSNRGINIVVLNDKTFAVEDVQTFDVYQDDATLIRFLKTGVQDGHLILAATLDEASYHLSPGGKQLLMQYGSSAISTIKFRDNFVMIGQKGLSQGKAVEKLLARDTGREFGDAVEMSGCLTIPLGELKQDYAMKIGKALSNCGVPQPCDDTAFSVHVYTGERNIDPPKICVDGKYIMAGKLNDAGRGLNIVVVNPSSKQVIRVGHFDTFGTDASNLEIFLEMLNDKEIVIVASHDEASTQLSDMARKMFNELGSSHIQNVKFRDMWALVTQKGVRGFSEFEQIEYAGDGWPKPIDMKLCVPSAMKGRQIKPDPIATKNNKRREFCGKYDGYGDFCDSSKVDDLLTPAPLSDRTLDNHNIFRIPVAVVPGLNFNAARMQLETLLLNPGIQPDRVTVFYDETTTAELALLADVFGFRSQKLASSARYPELLAKALVKVWDLYTTAEYVIVLEEEVIPTQDFLQLLARCLPAVQSDDTLIGISAWNINGYETVSTLPSAVYRTDTFPGLGFLLKRAFYDSAMRQSMNTCCMNRTWEGWLRGHLGDREMLVPDVSRVFRRPYVGLSTHKQLINELFNRRRTTNVDNSSVRGVGGGLMTEALTHEEYESQLNSLLSSAKPLDTSNAADCLTGNGLGFYIPNSSGKIYSVYYEQQTASDERILSVLCRCFGLFHVDGVPVFGKHRGLLRFSYKGNTMLFVGSQMEYYKHKPSSYSAVPLSALPPSV